LALRSDAHLAILIQLDLKFFKNIF